VLQAGKLFTVPLPDLSHHSGVPQDVLEQSVGAVSEGMVPGVVQSRFSPPRPRFGDAILDRAVVLPESGIFEISGQAGSGKSHVGFALAVHARVSAPSREVVLISTEGKVATARLMQIAGGRSVSVEAILSGIVISEADSVDQLRELVQTSLPGRFFDESRLPPSLVIIDSIAALFRLEYDANSAAERSRILFDIATTLKWLSTAHEALIVVTNQATANIGGFATNAEEWIPALGLSWANCVNVRVRLAKTNLRHEAGAGAGAATIGSVRSGPSGEGAGEGEGAEGGRMLVPIRTLQVEISPLRQGVRAQFFIDHSGVHGL
jgi:DNA-repair protein XRCC3